jgi:site-specific DNA-methyltransferase (adenine-specific)
MTWQIINGNSAEILKTYPDNSFDCVVTDPPYGISFLGKDWDHNTGDREVYEQCLRVLKPGGHLLAFSAARTYHHLAMTVETVGFEIRDQIMWIYGSGFPKSQDVGRQIDKSQNKGKFIGTGATQMSGGPKEFPDGALPRSEKMIHEPETDEAKQWSGWGTQLKPAHEPIVMARKPVIGSIRENVLEHGTGAINIDATRVIPSNDELEAFQGNWDRKASGMAEYSKLDGSVQSGQQIQSSLKDINDYKPTGRFPANVIHDGSDEVVSLFPSTDTKNNPPKKYSNKTGFREGYVNGVAPDKEIEHTIYNDGGSAARFFYCPKVSRSERHIGFDPNSQGVIIDSEVFGKTPVCLDCGKTRNGSTKHDGCDPENIGFQERRTERSSEVGNNHPTVKPIELMKYLIKLVTPPNGHILDPFNGSGSTGCAAVELGYDYTGIELDPNYVEIATKRISHWEQECKPKTTYNNLFEER